MKTTYRYMFNRRKSLESGNVEKLIELEVYFGHNVRTYINTKIRVEEKYWDTKRSEISKKHPMYTELNSYLQNLKETIHKEELTALERGKIFDREYLKRVLDDLKNDRKGNFIAYCRKRNHEDLASKSLKFRGWQKYETFINNLQTYVTEHHTKDHQFDFSDYTPEFVGKLETWAQNKYAESTVKKLHTSMRKYIKQAIKDGNMKKDPYEDFKFRKPRASERVNITEKELNTLENLDRELLESIDANMPMVLDRFLFSCYCGLRISDSMLLSKHHVVESDHGMVIDMVTEKMSGKRVILPVDLLFEGKGGKILRQYMELENKDDLVFPSLSEQKVNIKLKTLAAMTGIKRKLTFHIARHTCATLLAEKTGNPFVIMQILGHSDIKTSMIYIHNSTQAVVNSLNAAKW